MPPSILTIEWRSYDSAELCVTYADHIGPIPPTIVHRPVCTACWCDPRHEATCVVALTDVYRNLTGNLALVIALAAAAQGARISLYPFLRDDGYDP